MGRFSYIPSQQVHPHHLPDLVIAYEIGVALGVSGHQLLLL